jgi:hypothetical protein
MPRLSARASLSGRNFSGTEVPMASDLSIQLQRDAKPVARAIAGANIQAGSSRDALQVGDLVEVFDTDGWGPDGVWLRGTVYQLLPDGRYRVQCIGGGMTDVSPEQIKPCAAAPIAA